MVNVLQVLLKVTLYQLNIQGLWIKRYRFFQDGHVQNIKYHPMPEIPNHVCVTATVLPSMRKDRIYSVTILIHESTAHVVKA